MMSRFFYELLVLVWSLFIGQKIHILWIMLDIQQPKLVSQSIHIMVFTWLGTVSEIADGSISNKGTTKNNYNTNRLTRAHL